MTRFGIGVSLLTLGALNFELAAAAGEYAYVYRLICAAVIGAAGSLIAQGIDRWVDRIAR